MTIDIYELRHSLLEESLKSADGLDFIDVKHASADELIEMAVDYDVDLTQFDVEGEIDIDPDEIED